MIAQSTMRCTRWSHDLASATPLVLHTINYLDEFRGRGVRWSLILWDHTRVGDGCTAPSQATEESTWSLERPPRLFEDFGGEAGRCSYERARKHCSRFERQAHNTLRNRPRRHESSDECRSIIKAIWRKSNAKEQFNFSALRKTMSPWR